MPGLFDLDNPDLQRSLKEAILWCVERQLTATPADDERDQTTEGIDEPGARAVARCNA